jgi:hypothetical protein
MIKRILFLALTAIFTVPVYSKRIALVIGNDNYTSVAKLQKAGNDASSMSLELKKAGFEVRLHKDLNYRNLIKAIDSFSTDIVGGDEVVVFYAGHGVQLKSGNYLLPTDLEPENETQVEKTSYSLNDLTDKLNDAKPSFTLVIIDACRNNPLKSKGRSIGNSRGLSPIEPSKGQIIVYSASRGQEALDRLSDSDPNPNSVFTREFIKKMNSPGLKIEDIVRDVQDSVEILAKKVNHDQRPSMYTELRGTFYFYSPMNSTLNFAPSTPPKLTSEEREENFWNDAKLIGNQQAFESYKNAYPNGRYFSLAEARISQLPSVNSLTDIDVFLKIGMSSAEVMRKLNRPNIITTDKDGFETWIYEKIFYHN